MSEITLSQLQKHEVPKVQEILEAHYSGMSLVAFEVVNDRKFYYDPEQIQITDEVLAMLESFDGQDSAYSLYLDETAGIVIY